MELRHLRYFLAVAEEGSVTRAAARLRIAQPSLSQQIKALEREVGADLLQRRRGSRGAELTALGNTFAAEARAILEHVERSLDTISRQVRQEPAAVRIGCPAGLPPLFVDGLVTRVTAAVPGVAIDPVPCSSAEQLRALEDHHLDLGLVRLPCPGFAVEVHPVLDQQLGLWLPPAHPLIAQAEVPAAHLDGVDIAIFDRTVAPGFYDHVVASVAAAGARPRWHDVRVTDTAVWSIMKARGMAHLAVEELGQPAADLAWRPLTEPPLRMVTALAWTAPPSPTVAACLRALTSATGSRGAGP